MDDLFIPLAHRQNAIVCRGHAQETRVGWHALLRRACQHCLWTNGRLLARGG
jgi:hypothetical protein